MSTGDTAADWVDPDDAPELTDEWFDKADLMLGRQVIRRGRPPGSTKRLVSLRLDEAVIQAFSAEGRYLRQFGGVGTGVGQLARPRGLALAPDGRVCVSDALLCNVQVFQPDGRLLLALGGRATRDEPGLYLLPARLGCDETGRLYVVDQYLHKIEVLRPLSDAEGQRWLAAPPG